MDQPRSTSPARWLWLALGFVCVALGFIGAVVPLMPSTVFFVAAAACFERSSPRFEAWLLNLPGVGLLVRDYRAGRGMPLRAKWLACGMIALAVGLSLGRIPVLIGQVGWVLIGGFGIWYILARVPTKRGG